MLNPAQEKGLRDKLANGVERLGRYQAWIDGATATISTYTVKRDEVIEALEELKKLLFGFSNLIVEPANADPGKPVTISIDVTNLSSITDSCCLTLKVNGVVIGEREIDPLDSGETRTESYQMSRDEPGACEVDVSGQLGSFLVRSG